MEKGETPTKVWVGGLVDAGHGVAVGHEREDLWSYEMFR
jgi:hypothetical protein